MSEPDAKLRLVLDAEVCAGHGRCYEFAPKLFDEDDRGHCIVKQVMIEPEHEEAARKRVNDCPENALTLVMDDVH